MSSTLVQTLYAAASELAEQSMAFTLGSKDGNDTALGNMHTVYGCSGMAVSSSGVLYATGQTAGGDTSLFIVETKNGNGVLVGSLGLGNDHISDISFQPSTGILFAFSGQDHHLYTIDTTTGTATDIGSSGLGGQGFGMAFAPDGTLYLADGFTPVAIYTLDTGTGAATHLKDISFGNKVGALAYDKDGILYGSTTAGQLLLVDIDAGTITNVGGNVIGLDALAFGLPRTLDRIVTQVGHVTDLESETYTWESPTFSFA
jgi:DNA-binding beta-propeller fold protein YncE